MHSVNKVSVLAGFLLIVSIAPMDGLTAPRGIIQKPLKQFPRCCSQCNKILRSTPPAQL